MSDCGADAHPHVKSCAFSMNPGDSVPTAEKALAANYIFPAIFYHQHVLIHSLFSGTYFGKISEFNEVHRKRRSKAVANYLLGIPDPILRAAVIFAAGFAAVYVLLLFN
jgi:hypothetical protein